MPKPCPPRQSSATVRHGSSPEIDHVELEEMAACGCTVSEVAAWYGCTTAQMRVRLSDPTLKEIWTRGRGRGRVRLRRAQFRLAEKNISLAMMLGRHMLGQRDPERDGAPTVKLIVDTGIRRDEDPAD